MVEKFSAAEFIQGGGRIFRRREGRRTITIAYILDGDTIKYGATIHLKEKPSDVWNRRAHNQRAIERLTNASVIVPNQEFARSFNRENYLRSLLLELGCSSK